MAGKAWPILGHQPDDNWRNANHTTVSLRPGTGASVFLFENPGGRIGLICYPDHKMTTWIPGISKEIGLKVSSFASVFLEQFVHILHQ